MKVLFCTNAFERVTNGPAKFAHLLLNNASIVDMEVKILTEDVLESNDNVYKLNLKIPSYLKPLGQFIRMWKYHYAAMKIQQKYQFDVLVYNNALVGLWSSIKYPDTIGMINDYNIASAQFVNIIKKKEKFNKKHFIFFVEFFVVKTFSKIIVNSNYLKNQLINSYCHKKKNLYVLYKGIDNDFQIDESNYNRKRNNRSILFVKTNFEPGGLYDLLEAIIKLPYKVNLTIIGPFSMFHELIRNKISEYCITLTIKEYASQSEIISLMKSHEIFCVPSHKEALGVANIEAMACGCKIVSTNVGGIPEATGNTGVSWLVSPKSPFELMKAIEIAFDYDISECKQKVDEHLVNFSAIRVVSNFKDIIKS